MGEKDIFISMKNNYTVLEKQLLEQLYQEERKTAKEIAEMFHLSKANIKWLFLKYNITKPNATEWIEKHIGFDKVKRVVFELGVQKGSQKLKLTYDTLRDYCLAKDIPVDKFDQLKVIYSKEDIERMWFETLSLERLAKKLGVSYSLSKKMMDHYGLELVHPKTIEEKPCYKTKEQQIVEKFGKDYLIELYKKLNPDASKVLCDFLGLDETFRRPLAIMFEKWGMPIKTSLEKEKDRMKKELSKELLEDLHINKWYSKTDLMEKFKVSRNCIDWAFPYFGVKFIENQERFLSNPPSVEKLKELYIEKGLDSHEMAKIFKVDYPFMSEYLVSKGIHKKGNKYEVEIHNLFPSLSVHNQGILPGRAEIDFLNKEKQIGIEFNGCYWHSESVREDKYYHVKKSNMAAEKGIFIYHIFEYEWWNKSKKAIMLSQINNFFGKNVKIPARKCSLRLVESKEANAFLKENHIQGSSYSPENIGLYYKENLLAIMSFGKPRFTDSYEWELHRYCSKKGVNVVGGASKIFKAFLKQYKPTSIVSYSDIAKTKGNLYNILGFKQVGQSEPNYVWWKQLTVLSRYSCQKYKLVKQGFDPNKTEVQIMHERGFSRIWDCGNKVWVWKQS